MQQFKNVVLSIHQSLADRLNYFDKIMCDHLQSELKLIEDIQKFLNSHRGKLLRPIFTILGAELFNYQGKEHINLAAAVEYIHVATLLHDDVIDDSSLRHSQPTVNRLWDNKSAVLMGDYLFSHSFLLMVNTGSLQALHTLSGASILIAKGELHQLFHLGNVNLSIDEYLKVITSKTALLFEAAIKVGAIIAGASAQQIEAAAKVGLNFGIAYQIIDDINDYDPNFSSKIGKQRLDDMREGKVTLPLILARDIMSVDERNWLNNLITNPTKSPADLGEAVNLIEKHQGFTKAQQYALEYLNTSLQYLQNLNINNEPADHLHNLISSLKSPR